MQNETLETKKTTHPSKIGIGYLKESNESVVSTETKSLRLNADPLKKTIAKTVLCHVMEMRIESISECGCRGAAEYGVSGKPMSVARGIAYPNSSRKGRCFVMKYKISELFVKGLGFVSEICAIIMFIDTYFV